MPKSNDPPAAVATELEDIALEGATPPPAAATTKVPVGDKEFEVPADLAEALTAYNESVAAQVSELQQTVKALAAAAPKSEPVKKTEDYDYATQLFVDPIGALTRLKEEIRTELTSAYTKTESEKQFWSQFYAGPGKDLSDQDFMVKAVLARDFNEMASMPATKAMGELATRVKKELLKSMPKGAATKGNDGVEGVGIKSAAPKASAGNGTIPESMSQLLRDRRAARLGITKSGAAKQ